MECRLLLSLGGYTSPHDSKEKRTNHSPPAAEGRRVTVGVPVARAVVAPLAVEAFLGVEAAFLEVVAMAVGLLARLTAEGEVGRESKFSTRALRPSRPSSTSSSRPTAPHPPAR
eukprot:5290836-Prymnesium_polylepis.1